MPTRPKIPNDEALWYILDHIQESITALDSKLDKNTEETVKLGTQVPELASDVKKLTKILTEGNGTPSLIVQVAGLTKIVDVLHNQMSRVVKQSDPVSVSRERWKSIGRIAGIVGLALPGILAAGAAIFHYVFP